MKPLTPGDRLGPYEILGLPEASGLAGVYRARDTRGGEEVSIKLLAGRPLPAVEPAAGSPAMRAAMLVASGLVTVFDVRADGGVPYVVFEVLRGETLRARLQRAPLPVSEALRCAQQLARELAAAHDQGLVHAGLAAENVFLGRDGRTRVLDFVLTDGADGVPAAPVVGPRRDIEAWGRLARAMLGGGCPRPVRAIVERSLENDPARGYASARDLAAALEQAAAGQEAGPDWRQWTMWAAVAAATLAAALAALLAR